MRRWLEMQGRELDLELREIEADIAARDQRDINRKDAPLKAAPDAIIIDTSTLDKDAAISAALDAVNKAIGQQPYP